MKQISLIPFLLFFLMVTIVSTGCKKEGCRDTKANNYDPKATVDGPCSYDRDPFIGVYTGNENCTSGNFSWTLVVTPSTNDASNIILTNLGDFGHNIIAVVSGANISINDTEGGITYSGSGTLAGSNLTIIYQVSAAGQTDQCTATCIRQ